MFDSAKKLASLAVLVPSLVVAQDSPVRSQTSGTFWIVALVLIAVGAVIFWRIRLMRERKGPHGPRAPTPRGP